MVDLALDTYLGGRYGTPYQGLPAPDYVRNPSSNVSSTSSPAGPLDVNIVTPLPLPVTQVNEPLLPVETAMAPLGVIKNAAGDSIGRVMLGRVTNETTGVVTETRTAYFETGVVTPNYTGPWVIEGDCVASSLTTAPATAWGV